MEIEINDPRMETTQEIDIKNVQVKIIETEPVTLTIKNSDGEKEEITVDKYKEEENTSIQDIEMRLNMLERNKQALLEQIESIEEQIALFSSKKENIEEKVNEAMETKPKKEADISADTPKEVKTK